MIKKLIPYALLFCIIPTIVAQQTDYNRFSNINTGVGYIGYMNTFAISSGLPGTVVRLDYHGGMVSKRNPLRTFELVTKADYGYMLRQGLETDLNTPYHHAQLTIGGIFRQQIATPVPNFTVEAGVGVSLNLLAGYNPTFPGYGPILYGNWHISPDIYMGLRYNLKRWTFACGFNMPLLITGFFPEYQYWPNQVIDFTSMLDYASRPNTFLFFTEYLRLNSHISAQYCIKNTASKQWHLKASLLYETLRATAHFNRERMQKPMLTVGIVIERK